MNEILLLLITGAFAGTLAGLLGIGGGVIIVPVLVFVFQYQGIDPAIIMHLAIGTSLATIAVTSISSIYAHQAHRAILWPVFKKMVPGILIGAFLGAAIADTLPSQTLKLLFAPFLIAVAIQLGFGKPPKPHRQLPEKAGIFAISGLNGLISALFGIGGGALNVPFMTWCNIPVRQAVATSAAVGFPIAIAGTIGFVISGWGVENRPDWSIGFVNIPANLSIVTTSALMAPYGAKLAHTIPDKLLKKIFGILLIILAIKLLSS